jgi:hypothetical protein
MISVVTTRAALGALALALAAGVAHSSAVRKDAVPTTHVTPAEHVFADAAYGVDPVVTGPVSSKFKKVQAEAGCDEAVWPNIPLACYPN